MGLDPSARLTSASGDYSEVHAERFGWAGAGINGGYGYPDASARSGATGNWHIWEVKPATEYGYKSGRADLARYTATMYVQGIPVRPGGVRAFIPTDVSTSAGDIRVFESTESPGDRGLILYKFNEEEREKRMQEMEVNMCKTHLPNNFVAVTESIDGIQVTTKLDMFLTVGECTVDMFYKGH